jgi:hypothetical protein
MRSRRIGAVYCSGYSDRTRAEVSQSVVGEVLPDLQRKIYTDASQEKRAEEDGMNSAIDQGLHAHGACEDIWRLKPCDQGLIGYSL